jgi:hypothetical protein
MTVFDPLKSLLIGRCDQEANLPYDIIYQIIYSLKDFEIVNSLRLCCKLFYEISFKNKLFRIRYTYKIVYHINEKLSIPTWFPYILDNKIIKYLQSETDRVNIKDVILIFLLASESGYAIYDNVLTAFKSNNMKFKKFYIDLFEKYHKKSTFSNKLNLTKKIVLTLKILLDRHKYYKYVVDYYEKKNDVTILYEMTERMECEHCNGTCEIGKSTITKIFGLVIKRDDILLRHVNDPTCLYNGLNNRQNYEATHILYNIIRHKNVNIPEILEIINEHMASLSLKQCSHNSNCVVTDYEKKNLLINLSNIISEL